jgi:hypothetical protein
MSWSATPSVSSTASTARGGGGGRARAISGEKMAAAFDGFAAGGALDYEVLDKGQDAFDVNVTGCRYARFYREIGAPDLGFLLVCSSDFDMAEGFGPEVQFTRTQTIKQGASHCDFRYRLKKAAKAE